MLSGNERILFEWLTTDLNLTNTITRLIKIMNRKTIRYSILAIVFLGTYSLASYADEGSHSSISGGSMSALAQQHQHGTQHLDTTSFYIEQLDSFVRGLSSEEVDELLNGEGAGYARMAELNSYPGPRHVLDLRSQLNLSAQQIEDVQAVFDRMQSEAKNIGQTIIAKEQQLSDLFASGIITNADLEKETNKLGQLYGKLRKTHLQAHLQITPLLSAEQIRKYNEIRGY